MLMSEQDYDLIEKIYNEIHQIVRKALFSINVTKFSLLMYGSTVNGLAVRGSADLDLTLLSSTEG
jgi:hypothetical protein